VLPLFVCLVGRYLVYSNASLIQNPKVATCFTDTHVAQMVGYLNITGLDLALLLNFKNARLEWKRVLRPRKPGEHDKPDLHA
jgi:hypothetical protein